MFKVGDEVVIIDDDDYVYTKKGSVGVIEYMGPMNNHAMVLFSYIPHYSGEDHYKFTILLKDCMHTQGERHHTPVSRKIKEMEKRWVARQNGGKHKESLDVVLW